MNDGQQTQKVTVKSMLLIILVAVVTAVAVTLLQVLILKQSHAAVTGGVVGAVMALFAIRIIRRNAA